MSDQVMSTADAQKRVYQAMDRVAAAMKPGTVHEGVSPFESGIRWRLKKDAAGETTVTVTFHDCPRSLDFTIPGRKRV